MSVSCNQLTLHPDRILPPHVSHHASSFHLTTTASTSSATSPSIQQPHAPTQPQPPNTNTPINNIDTAATMAADKPTDETPVAPVENKETKAAALGEDDEFEDFPVDGAFEPAGYRT